MDARTGLERFRDFTTSNYQLIEDCRTRNVDAIMQLPGVVERVELYRAHHRPACAGQVSMRQTG